MKDKTRLFFVECEKSYPTYGGVKTLVIIDGIVKKTYSNATLDYYIKSATDVVVLNSPENEKNIERYYKILKNLSEGKYEKTDHIVAIGGGATLDLGGFCAATYMRGMKLTYVPTTMLAATDSAYGGKNGINCFNTKNTIGTFYNPDYVVIDPDFLLKKLTVESFYDLAEVFKYVFISPYQFEEQLKNLYNLLKEKEEALRRNNNSDGINFDKKMQISKLDTEVDCLNEDKYSGTGEKKLSSIDKKINDKIVLIVENSYKFKRKITDCDPFDEGTRHILNFGHTVAHAMEMTSGSVIPHSKAVIMGIEYSLYAGIELGITTPELLEKYYQLCAFFGFSENYLLTQKDVLCILHDKKMENNQLYEPFALPYGDDISIILGEQKIPVVCHMVDVDIFEKARVDISKNRLRITDKNAYIVNCENAKPKENFSLKLDSSKSHSHRFLILAAIFGGTVKNISFCDDCVLTLNALRSLGAIIDIFDDVAVCSKQLPNLFEKVDGEEIPTVFCGDSASTLRFLLPIALSICKEAKFVGSNRLFKRGLEPIIRVLEDNSVPYVLSENQLHFTNNLHNATVIPSGEATSQFASGFYFADCLKDNTNHIIFTNEIEKLPYFIVTKACVKVYKDTLQLGKCIVVPPDCSTYLYYYVLSKMSKSRIERVPDKATFFEQGEYSAFDIVDNLLERYFYNRKDIDCDRDGIRITEKNTDETACCEFVKTKSLHESQKNTNEMSRDMIIDGNECIDSIPIIVAIAAIIDNQCTIIKGVERLRNKESDRLVAIADALGKMGAKVEVVDDGLKIVGVKKLHNAICATKGDHRITMMIITTALIESINVAIDDVENIKKSSIFFVENIAKCYNGFAIGELE